MEKNISKNYKLRTLYNLELIGVKKTKIGYLNLGKINNRINNNITIMTYSYSFIEIS